jgi:hypothetical protein
MITMFGGGLELRAKNRNLIRREKLGQSMNDLQQINKNPNAKRKSNGRLSKEFASSPISDSMLTFANDSNNNMLRRSSTELLPKMDTTFLSGASIRT